MVSATELGAHPAVVATDASADFREDLLNVVASVGLRRAEVVVLVEMRTGHAFEACAPAELLPLLRDLLALARRTTRAGRRSACNE